MAIKYKRGDILWLVPIRYWEDGQNPDRVIVAEDADERAATGSLYVEHERYPDPDEGCRKVFVPAERCFTDREKAIAAADLLTKLRDLKDDDENEYICARALDEDISTQHDFQFADGPLARKEALSQRTGYMEIPDHHLGDRANVRVTCCHEQVLYWSSYEAGKAAAARPCDSTVVEVEVRSIQVLEG